MSQAKVLVLGSNSFSGSHFVAQALKASHPVWGVSRSAEPMQFHGCGHSVRAFIDIKDVARHLAAGH